MLTNKDYCDYDTCVALREVGCRIETEWYIHQPSYERGSCYLCFGIPRETSVLDECDYIPRLSLYEAQKWMREIHNIFVMIDRSFAASNSWHYVICANDDFEHLIEQPSLENYSYEEALSEGIKEAVKILKEK